MLFNLLDEVTVINGFYGSGSHVYTVVGHKLVGRDSSYVLILRDEPRTDPLMLREWFREVDLQKYDYRKQHTPIA